MRSIDRIMEDKKRKRRPAEPEEPDELELTVHYPRMAALNRAEGIFDRDLSKKWGGINTAPSVFAKSAVFPASPPEED